MAVHRVWDRPASVLRLGRTAATSVHRQEIISVLERASRDNDFLARLASQDEGTLQGYTLTSQEKAALLSGDLPWVEARLGKLNAQQRIWFECRLQQEIW
jgi:hypothetical protein